MKNITKIIISTFLVILLINGALGFPGMGGNSNATNSNITNITNIPLDTQNISQIDLNNTTSSDQDIVLVQHLIEVDAAQLKAENKLLIRETLIFRNIGTKDFFGDLRTWIPDGSEGVIVARSEMMTGGGNVPINFSQNGNIISWKDYVEKNSSLPFLYALEYTVQQKAGTSNAEIYTKKLAVPTLTSYRYVENPNIGSALVVKITAGNTVQFTDENGNKIAATDVNETAGIFRFSSPKFNEINVEISSSPLSTSASQSYAPYIVIGILIILALLYPYIKKKLKSENGKGKGTSKTSEKNRTKETKINKTENIEKSSEAGSAVSSGKYEGKKVNELLDIKKQLLSRIKDLEQKYEAGDLLDEDYEDKRKSYQDNLKEIEEKLKKMG
ncbi:MAG: hypothetical protein ACXVEB_17260 [Bacteroidia bacterium]